MAVIRTTNFDRLAASAPLDTTASVVRDGTGEHWTPQAKDDRIHSDVPIPCARLPDGAADLTGHRVGRLVVIGYHSRRKKNGRMWVVRCQCGAYEVRKGSKLTAERPADAPELTCADCESLRHAQHAHHAAVTGRWPGGEPVTQPLGLNVQGCAKTLNDLGALEDGPPKPRSTSMTKSKIYLAARYSRFQEMQGYRSQLEARGYEVTSRWINGDHQVNNDALAEARNAERIRFATEDRADLMAASIVIAFTEEPRKTTTRGGRHVEAGIALATGKRLIVSGWRENVFYCLPEVEFVGSDFSDVLKALDHPASEGDGFQWYWTEGDDLEICRRGGSTREETIAKALREVPVGGVFTILEADKQTARAPDADEIIDLFGDINEECWGEDGFEGLSGAPEVIASAKLELTGVVEAWFDRHSNLIQEPWFFDAQRNEQMFLVTAEREAVPVSRSEVGQILANADV